MRILCLDTSTLYCSAGLSDNEYIVAELSVRAPRAHTKFALKWISEILSSYSIDLRDIDLFAAGTGPGSFTGIRIGLSLIKGLAMALDKPCTGISTLTAIAMSCNTPVEFICSMIDAGRDEVYAAIYKYRAGGIPVKVSGPVAGSVDDVCKNLEGKVFFVGDGADKYKHSITSIMGGKALFSSYPYSGIPGKAMTRLAMQEYISSADKNYLDLCPVYVRPPDIRDPGKPIVSATIS